MERNAEAGAQTERWLGRVWRLRRLRALEEVEEEGLRAF
jgi:hypothetical protein